MDLGGGAETKINLFSEYGHVAYQIKAGDAGSNKHGSNYLAHRHTLDPGGGVKRSNYLFLKVVMLHIKLKGIEHRAP